jgi:subtilisin family serine protease
MADFGAEAFEVQETEDADAVVFDELGIAVVGGEPEQASAMTSIAEDGGDFVVEPEYMNYAFGGLDDDLLDQGTLVPDGDGAEPTNSLGSLSADYLLGYQQAVNSLVEALRGGVASGTAPGAPALETLAAFSDTSAATWGLQATRVTQSRFSGQGIRVAVLDTGFDLRHPDFAGRVVRHQSFITGESAQDGHGHGTHCIGTACGPRQPTEGPRYGVAFQAEIFAGKVLGDSGSGGDSSILNGINWAVRNECSIISMSLGRRVSTGERPARSYEVAGRRALQAGTLIIAAAGNDSHRPFVVRPVSSPANSTSIAGVAAVDEDLRVARFSNRGINPSGGEINLAGPGVNILSSWPTPVGLKSINGTSMATPHVAGIAALIAEEMPSARGVQLYHELRRRARQLSLSRADAGNGLVEAV